MTEEQNPPQAQSHEAESIQSSQQGQPSQGQSPQGPAPQGQSRSRRRRRKRKGGKGTVALQADGAQQPEGAPQPTGQAAAAPAPPKQQPQGQGQGQGQKQGKRFFKKSRGSGGSGKNENPGNQINANPGNGNGGQGSGQGGGQGRRRNKQRRGPQVFVGPMDHSYRSSNGNFADSPPSTIEVQGNGHSNGYRNDSYGGGNGNGNGNYAASGGGYGADFPSIDLTPVATREDAPTRIVCFIDDLFFTAKIQETARKLGVKVAFVKADKDIVAQLTGKDEETRPALIVFDLNNLNAKPLTLIPKLKAKLKKGTSIVGFLSHLQGDLKMKATEAGCDTVMPRSAFSQNLPNLLRRYGLIDELESLEQ